MKKLYIFLFTWFGFIHNLPAIVNIGGTWVTPQNVLPSCLGQEYVSVGFHVNLQVNNDYFQVQRSQDPNFSWAINASAGFNGFINGCGTCGYNMYSLNDYGPFSPNETWYYRVKAVSNGTAVSFHSLGTYVTNIPTIVNWVHQVTDQYLSGSSPSTENSYVWNQEPRDGQGVIVSLGPTEISPVILEQYNHKLVFKGNPANPFFVFDININNNGYTNVYNGAGITSFELPNSVSIFSSITSYNLKIRYTDSFSNIVYREYVVHVIPKSDAFYTDNYCNTIRVWKGNDPLNGTPLILSEGFDAYSNKAQQYYRKSGNDLINCLLNKGFNVYIVDYYLNAQSIVNNAAVFQSAIRYVSSINNNRKVVACGMSMGGVINRYACTAAEASNNPLPISKFVSIDAPQQGAVISADMQDWRKASTNDPFEIAASNNDAAKQLLKYNAYDPNGSIHNAFYASLNALNGDGYPHLVEKIGVSFSNPSANPGTNVWLALVPNALLSPTVFVLSTPEKQAGSFLPPLNIDPVHFYLPLIRISVSITQFANPTFIPFESALDVVNNVSKFDRIIMPQVTGFHDQIPNDIIEPFVNAVLEKNVYIQNKNYSLSRNIIARDLILCGDHVNALQASGAVDVNPGPQISFKAGKEIVMQDGFNAYNGSEFEAITGTVQCNWQSEFQNRIISNEQENPTLPSNPDPTDPSAYLNDPNTKIEFFKSTDASNLTEGLKPEVFPNPSNGELFISSLPSSHISYSVLDVRGRILLSGESETRKIDISALDKGVYILNLVDLSGSSYNYKIIRN
ncbi:MAG TPA: T9SS type A sorting domain-containing protein [Bacteroidia bacterium]|nr:T9SS type A sorting domain-containing protein [Bacteroidia bacterium]